VGYLGRGPELGARLRELGLGLAGAYLELPYWDARALDAAWPALDAVLEAFDAVGPIEGKPAPRPTLAAAGTEARHANPGRAVRDHALGLDDQGWVRFGEGLNRVVAESRRRGYEPTFHPETGTYVEAPWEIERMLDVSDIGLCLETGHLMVGGGDPVKAVADWGPRINHVHLKDARRSVIAGIVHDGAPSSAIWAREAFAPLGEGDLDVDAVLAALRALGYEGWLVVEQDSYPQTAARFAQAAADQRANRAFLAARGL
jgi:inosose dehydratase